jgi:hypothetical protein
MPTTLTLPSDTKARQTMLFGASPQPNAADFRTSFHSPVLRRRRVRQRQAAVPVARGVWPTVMFVEAGR